MESSGSSVSSSAVSLELYSSAYMSEYWWSGTDVVAKIQTLAQPMYAITSSMDSMLFYRDMTPYVEVYISLGNCAENSSQALSSSVRNCAQACFDSSILYMPYNLEACLNLGVAAMLIQNGTLVLNETESDTKRALDSYHIGNLSTWDGASVVQNIVDCAAAACTQSNVDSCPSNTLALDGLTVTADNLETVYSGLSSFCDNVGTHINSDIAGPGVMFSYLVQICAALLFWIIAKVLNSWTRVISWPFLLCSSRPPPSFDPLLSPESHPKTPGRRKTAWIRATAVQARLSRLRLNAATSTTLVEFQEIQAFFVGAIQIATLATFKPTGSAQSDSANTMTFGEAIGDSQLVQTLCINGTLPILLIQCLLQRCGMRWWYTFTLVKANFILAIVVKARSSRLIADFETLWKIFVASKPVDSCGGMANPQVYCDTFNTDYGGFSVGIYCMYFIVPVLVIDFMAPSIMQIRSVNVALNNWRRTSRGFRYLEGKVWPPFVSTFWFFVEFVLVFFVCSYFTELLVMFVSRSGELGMWGFGQLVAVMVWVPPLLKFVYFNVFGIEEGLGRRMAHDYRVVHDEHATAQRADMSYGVVELDELQQGHAGSRKSTYDTSEPGSLTPSLRMGTYDHLIQSPPEPYSSDYKSSWTRRWPTP